MSREILSVFFEFILQFFFMYKRRERMGETLQIPIADTGLILVAVSSLCISMVADITALKGIEKGKRTVIDSKADGGHIIGVHDTVIKSNRLPVSDKLCRPLNNLRKHF